MKSYKQMWEELKSNVDNPEVLKMMRNYEQMSSSKRKKDRGHYYGIMKEPWYDIYQKLTRLMPAKVKKGLLPANTYVNFKKEVSNWIKLLQAKQKTNQEMEDWLKSVHTDICKKRLPIELRTKPSYTPSGFKRMTKSKLSLEDRANIVIDEIVYKFTARLPKDYPDFDITRYEQDIRQELWLWLWEHRKTDSNLYNLIINYNALSSVEYSFYITNLYSRINSYIVPYAIKLHYSCNDMARYRMNYKYKEEELYPANELEILDKINTDLSEKRYDDIDTGLLKLDNENIIKDIFTELDHRGFIRKRKLLQLRYGFNDEDRPYTLQECADYFSVTKERARQIENEGLKKIRDILRIKYKRSEDLF